MDIGNLINTFFFNLDFFYFFLKNQRAKPKLKLKCHL
jgi:hypothetical protein